jgi:imidazolonepropionase
MGMTIDEAVWAATAGGAAALRRVDIGILANGARADLIVLSTADPIDFVYRPGVHVIASTIIGGSRV